MSAKPLRKREFFLAPLLSNPSPPQTPPDPNRPEPPTPTPGRSKYPVDGQDPAPEAAGRIDSSLARVLADFWQVDDAELVIWRWGVQLVEAVHESLSRQVATGSIEIRRSRSGYFMATLREAWRQGGGPPLPAPGEFTRPDPAFWRRHAPRGDA